jgi:hypothetical protein
MSEADEQASDAPATAQDVIDALRLAFMAQTDPERLEALTRMMLELAPETDSNRGVQLLIDLIEVAS